MVYFILSRHGYDQLVAAGGLPTTPLWVSGGVLSEQELSDLRSRGYDITDFNDRIDPAEPDEIMESVDTIRLHHSGQVVWVESGTRPNNSFKPTTTSWRRLNSGVSAHNAAHVQSVT